MFFDVAGFRDRSAWQWQPTLSAHDPSPPLTLGAETPPDPPGEVTLAGDSSVGTSATTGILAVKWNLVGDSEGWGATGNVLLPGQEVPGGTLYPGASKMPLRVTWALSGTTAGGSTTTAGDIAFGGTSAGSSATGFWWLPDAGLYPDAGLFPGLTTTDLELVQFARPVADIAAAGWVVAPLWSKLDEETPNDADLVTGVCA